MAVSNLEVQVRELKGKQGAKKVRNAGSVPGVLYVKDGESTLLSIDSKALLTLLHTSGRNTVVNLAVGKEKNVNAFIYEIQHHPLTGDIIHVDMKLISLTEKIHVTIPVHLDGVPFGVKNEGGIVEHIRHSLDISCLPANIPNEIVVDIKDMHLHDIIHVRDLKLENIEILNEPESTIVHVITPKVVAVEEEALDEEAVELDASGQPEVVGEEE